MRVFFQLESKPSEGVKKLVSIVLGPFRMTLFPVSSLMRIESTLLILSIVFELDEGNENRLYVSHRVSERGRKSMATKVFIYGKVG
jgi:hypothetical protein